MCLAATTRAAFHLGIWSATFLQGRRTYDEDGSFEGALGVVLYEFLSSTKGVLL